ncbi:MAG TPA: hypothetical protein VGM17_01960 [Rhizomicrobium sp.]
MEGPVPGVPDAQIRWIEALPDPPDSARRGPKLWRAPGMLQFEVPGVARYLICGGVTVDVAPFPGADPGAISLFAHQEARAALIHQRGELPLHACTLLAPSGTAIAICGHSAIGKSTLAAEMCRRGWLLVADGITRVSMSAVGPIAWPSDSSVKLWKDSCKNLGIEPAGLQRVRQGADRFAFACASAKSPVPLPWIAKFSVSPVAGFEPVNQPAGTRRAVFAEYVYKPRFGSAASEGAQTLAHLVQQSRAYLLRGARSRPITEIAEYLELALQ